MTKPNTIKIDEVEYVRADMIPAPYVSRKEGAWEIGKKYVIRTLTMTNHGLLIDVTPTDFVLTQAAWIADTGRYADFLSGKIQPNEVEPYPQDAIVLVNRASYVDAIQLNATFDKQK